MITGKNINAIRFTLKSTSKIHVSASSNVTNDWVNFKKIFALPLVWLVSLELSLKFKSEKGIFQLNHWQFSKKAKSLIAVAIIVVFLISVFAFIPKQDLEIGNVVPQNGVNSTASPSSAATNHENSPLPVKTKVNINATPVSTPFPTQPKSPGVIESAQVINSTVWMEVAENAWAYYQPGIGVDNVTGLPYADTGFHGFTDWDLGGYIQACIDAQTLGLISSDSAWDFSARINKVLTFLENRPLGSSGYPYQFYNSTTGNDDFAMSSNESVDGIDTGRLLVALNNLISYNSSLQQTVDNIVLYGRSNYAALLPAVNNDILTSTSIYSYYTDSGFASFWPLLLPNPVIILNNMFSAGSVTTYGISLPKASITGDPLLCSIFELNNKNTQLMTLSKQVYLASEANYNATGNYVAFGEGNGPLNEYLWEWVVMSNGTTWRVAGNEQGFPPMIYNKVAFSFLALYNTTYARNMVIYLERSLPDPINGYYEATDNSRDTVEEIGSNTNSLILDAALYAIQK